MRLIFEMSIGNSISPISHLKKQVEEYLQSLHELSEGTKDQYSWSLNAFADYLERNGKCKFDSYCKAIVNSIQSPLNPVLLLSVACYLDYLLFD